MAYIINPGGAEMVVNRLRKDQVRRTILLETSSLEVFCHESPERHIIREYMWITRGSSQCVIRFINVRGS
jgi:hypothetical protein